MPYIFNAIYIYMCTCLLLVILVVQKFVNESIAVNALDSLLSIIMVILLQLYSDELTRSTTLGGRLYDQEKYYYSDLYTCNHIP